MGSLAKHGEKRRFSSGSCYKDFIDFVSAVAAPVLSQSVVHLFSSLASVLFHFSRPPPGPPLPFPFPPSPPPPLQAPQEPHFPRCQ